MWKGCFPPAVARHTYNPSHGTRHRLRANRSRNIGLVATVSAIALIGRSFWSLAQLRSSPHENISNRRPPVGLATAIRRIAPRPVLLITGGRGNRDEALNSVYQAAGGPTVSLWEIPEAGHTGGLAAEPDQYERRVADFFESALLR